MTIPLLLRAGLLVPADFHRYSTLFAKSASDFFPDYEIRLIPLEEGEAGIEDFAAAVAAIRDHGLPVVDTERQELFLPIWAEKALCGILAVRGGEPRLFAMPIVWLDEQSHIISREFHILKQSCLDPATGLLNGFHLQSELDALLLEAGVQYSQSAPPPSSLALLEVYPHSRDADRSLRYIVRAGSCLVSILGEEMHLHHLGAGIFGLLWYGVDRDEARQLGDDLLLRLKREDFASAHLGITAVVPPDPVENSGGEQVLGQAWQALRTARRRGPFSLCRHVTASDIASHPLRKIPETVLRKLRTLYRGKTRFSLALLSLDQEPTSDYFKKRVQTVAGQMEGVALVPVNQRETFLFLDGLSSEEACAWLGEFRERMKALETAFFSVGLTTFPYHDFIKASLPLNCRKALIHAAFFGPGSLAVFDAVSLNISGDVYYNEGDLVRAVEEYRRGLLLDPASLNLLNSLAVACVQLNRPKAAGTCFQKALAVDDKNFMALFNLGFIRLEDGDRDGAKALWERALAVDDKHVDLLRHLGVLSYRLGDYQQARKLLERCEVVIRKNSSQQGGEPMVIARWLGRACEACGDHGRAIVAYQRAVGGNPRDAGSLSRLGRLYALENQGKEIALSLCREAVELDGGKAEHWYRLGLVQELSQDLEGAAFSLAECLHLAPNHPEAAMLLGRTLEGLKLPDKAARVYRKILHRKPEHLAARNALAALA